MSDFYGLWRDFHVHTPITGLQRQKGQHKCPQTCMVALRRKVDILVVTDMRLGSLKVQLGR